MPTVPTCPTVYLEWQGNSIDQLGEFLHLIDRADEEVIGHGAHRDEDVQETDERRLREGEIGGLGVSGSWGPRVLGSQGLEVLGSWGIPISGPQGQDLMVSEGRSASLTVTRSIASLY